MLPFAVVDEHGVYFETGVPVKFRYVRNTERAPRPGFVDTFQQKLEPFGRFMLHVPNPEKRPRGWETGTVRFESPLVLFFNTHPGAYYDSGSWKAQLNQHYRKRGMALTRALLEQGYDGIVTVMPDADETREIVDLRP